MITETYVASAGQKIFTFTFDVISAAYLTVTLDGSIVTDWELTASQEITLGSSVNPVDQQVLAISRETPVDVPLVTFADPSAIRAREIDLAIKQLLHHLQEIDGQFQVGLQKNASETYWETEGLPMRNLPTPVEDDEPATKGFVNGQIVASGQLPPVGPSEAGKNLAVNAAGTGFEFAEPTLGRSCFRMPLLPEGNVQSTQRSSQILVSIAGSMLNTTADAVQLSATGARIKFAAAPTLNFGFTDAIGWDSALHEITLPAGHVYRVQFDGTAHNMATATAAPGTTPQANLQIRGKDTVGYEVYAAQTLTFGTVTANPADTPLQVTTFTLDAFVDTRGGAETIILAGGRTTGDLIGLDVPAAVVIEEML